jgi:hypothetical protein
MSIQFHRAPILRSCSSPESAGENVPDSIEAPRSNAFAAAAPSLSSEPDRSTQIAHLLRSLPALRLRAGLQPQAEDQSYCSVFHPQTHRYRITLR